MQFIVKNRALLLVIAIAAFLCVSPVAMAVIALAAIAYIVSASSDKRTKLLDKLKDIFIERR